MDEELHRMVTDIGGAQMIQGPIRTNTGKHAVITQINGIVTGVTGEFPDEVEALHWAVQKAKDLPNDHAAVTYNVVPLYTP